MPICKSIDLINGARLIILNLLKDKQGLSIYMTMVRSPHQQIGLVGPLACVLCALKVNPGFVYFVS